ncbi:site-specific DNA-methyltransferase [Paraclostridium bifermentans]|uniref:site-specific DNA-methyltransferase n=1 Tax=Paraclostridium bifermentans TaxID=1490 RepID=UPI0024306B88|nr:site-specific DNA-methyltransferase [Paraclostridium bifermentans]
MNKVKEVEMYELEKPNPIKGYPELYWRGKRPFTSTQYYPAQLKERYGEEDESGWMNKIFWGDNLQVMSHLLKEYRGKVDLIYIDPPFDSKADYKKKVKIKGKKLNNNINSFEEKQYSDIWINDEYIQFMYERLILIRELLSDTGIVYVHCDWHKSHYIRCIMDSIFGISNFINEIIWSYKSGGTSEKYFARKHDNLLVYGKTEKYKINIPKEKSYNRGFKPYNFKNVEEFEDEVGWHTLVNMRDVWEIDMVGRSSSERVNYPTQKPEKLIERIIESSSRPSDLVFDCFMGSGTTQAVAMRLGRRFIGSDINIGSVSSTTKRLLNIHTEKKDKQVGFEVYNVNNYDIFRNPSQAKDLLIDALDIQPLGKNYIYDGELNGKMVKIMPVNRIATRADLGELIVGLPYKTFEKREAEHPNSPVESIMLVCMGHEPDLKAHLQSQVDYKLDIEIVDILRDKTEIQFKRESEVEITIKDGTLIIDKFYPKNLLQKMSLLEYEDIEDWKELVESIVIDFNYDGVVIEPSITDIPDKKELVKGEYQIPKDAGVIKVKITDILSEACEWEGTYE